MGNRRHLDWLLEGVASWNERRRQNLFQPDFQKTNIRMSFIEAGIVNDNELLPLAGVNLLNANLFEADLGAADLRGASLSGATLRKASFRAADLEDANF